MKNLTIRILAITALGLVLAFGSAVAVSPAGAQADPATTSTPAATATTAQELDLCALLGGQYCPDGGVGSGDVNQGGGSRPGGVNNAGLARTGSNFGSLIGIGAGLVLLGGAAAFMGRRRTQGDA